MHFGDDRFWAVDFFLLVNCILIGYFGATSIPIWDGLENCEIRFCETVNFQLKNLSRKIELQGNQSLIELSFACTKDRSRFVLQFRSCCFEFIDTCKLLHSAGRVYTAKNWQQQQQGNQMDGVFFLLAVVKKHKPIIFGFCYCDNFCIDLNNIFLRHHLSFWRTLCQCYRFNGVQLFCAWRASQTAEKS